MEHYKTGSLWDLLCGDKVELLKFLNGNNANNKVNRWPLELATYNITFVWISGACNKAADCLLLLVDVKDTPATSTASIYRFVTSTLDSPATRTCSKTHNPTNTTHPTDVTTTSTTDKVNAPQPLTEDCKSSL